MNPNRPLAEKILNDKEISGPEVFVSQVYSLSGDPRLIARTIPLGERYLIALQIILSILSVTGAPSLPIVETKKPVEKGPPVTPTQPSEETIPDFYAVLGVSPTATEEEIKKAHRELIKKYHPDVFAGQELSEEQLAEIKEYAQEINLAYLTLSKDKNREEYDRLRTMFSTAPSKKPPKEPGVVGTAATGLAKKGVKQALVKTGAKVAAKLGLREVVSDVAAALTAASGPLAVVIGPLVKALTWVATWLAEKVIGRIAKWIRENKEAVLLAAILGAGLLTGNPLLLIGGLAFGAVLFFSTLILPAIVMAVGVIGGSFIFVIFLVAIILFIINSSAYVVPHHEAFSLVAENPFIGVVKEASPPGPFANGDLPIAITYKITVTARMGTLSNITFAHECEVIRQGSTDTCPAPLPSSTPSIISPVEPFVYTYTQTYSGSRYIDSLVINTFTVSADTPEVQQTSASGATSIIIGTPPTACYVVTGNWPAAEQAMILSAVSNLVGNQPRFVQRLCAVQSQVNLVYDPSKVCGVWGCAPIGGNTIYFNSGGLGNLRNATYILAHESGHVLAYGAPQLYAAYRAYPGTLGELPVCTYGGLDPNEGFAEAIAKYAINDSCMANEPNNYQFVDTQIFR